MTFTDLRIGLFLAVRELRHTSLATNVLIVFVMTLTFLNLIVLRGILMGIPEGATSGYLEKYTSDVIISALDNEKYILRSKNIINIVENDPKVKGYTGRTLMGALVVANYKERLSSTEKPNSVNGILAGISPTKEDNITGLKASIIEGRYLEENERDAILIGANLTSNYSSVQGVGESTLNNISPGTKVRIQTGATSKEFTVVGILKSKVSQVERRIFMTQDALNSLIYRGDSQFDEIAIKASVGVSADELKKDLLKRGVGKYAKVQTYIESQPQFLNDIKGTFGILGDLVGTVGLLVASITIFIVIFVNAITKKKYIGILKGIGITNEAIEISYMIQSMCYAIIGSLIGVIILYGWLVPYFEANPIPFPFADGILLATTTDTIIRLVILCLSTIIAGYIPARLVVKQNTLNAILGR